MVRGFKSIIEYILSVLKVSCLFIIALFLPRAFLYYVSRAPNHDVSPTQSVFKLGLESLSGEIFLNKQGKPYTIALITNHTGKDQAGRRNIDILLQKGVIIKAIFTPKHGYYATKAEAAKATAHCDERSNIPIISWDDKSDTRQSILTQIDMLLFDMQDSGVRYGYAPTLLEILKEASLYNKKVVVLDRPNVLGSYMEGSLDYTTLCALPIPIRHGMTSGELATFFNKHVVQKPVELQVVPMEHYTRHAQDASKSFCHVSPNIKTMDACYGYSFLGLLGEIAPFDIGIGTDKAFQCLMLPENKNITKQQWYTLRTILKNHGVESKLYRNFHQRKKQYYCGLKIQIPDINNFSSFNTLFAILDFFKQEGIALSFSPRFDAALGTTKIREFFEGNIELSHLEELLNDNLTSFYAKAMDSFIYKPLPQMVRL